MGINEQLAFTNVKDLQSQYAAKEISPVEVTNMFIDRIERLDGQLNAFLEHTFDLAREKAKEAEKEILDGTASGLLHGIPTSIKDMEMTKGIKTTAGSLIFKDRIPEFDSVVSERVKKENAIILGKTNTPEFGLLGETRNKLGDDCRNPWNTDMTPGGSSGGAAVSLVSGMCSLATGSDGGGSVRVPASFSGVYGIKPTQGRIPRFAGPVSDPISNQHSQGGPMARSVEDAAILFQAMAGFDPRDVSSLRQPVPDFIGAAKEGAMNGVKGLRIGWTPDYGFGQVDPEVLDICKKAVSTFTDIGCSVEESDFAIEDPFPHWLTLFSTFAYSMQQAYWPERKADMNPYAVDLFKYASNSTAVDFTKAVGNVDSIKLSLAEQFDKFDLLISPTMPVAPYQCGKPTRQVDGYDVDGSWNCLQFTYPINSSGHPAASIPAGLNSDGLPIGLHIIGKFGDEETIIKASAAFEKMKPWNHVRPPVS
tara:strand:- start:24901 stop:26337 length:1437 start_codon:yes stop_codon:yes gene_type:complete